MVKRFGGVTALAGVDMTLAPGEILGLIGPNGSGKTTLVNCISGALPIDEGEISLGGRPLPGSRVGRARAGIARTFQNLRLFGQMTVRENVIVGTNATRRGGRAPGDVEALLERLRLQPYARTAAASLPYGYQRRVEIARALAGRPSVLLLDEPAAGLNETETEELLTLLREIRSDDGIGIVLIDHDMNLVIEVSDRVQVLDGGRVIFEGDPKLAFAQQHVVEAYLGVEG